MSFEGLPESAREALRVLAFLDPAEIPTQFFEACGGIGPALADLDLKAPTTVADEIIEPLERYSLIQVGSTPAANHLRIHRLVQEVVLHDLNQQDELSSVFEKAHNALDQCFPSDPGSPDSWEPGRLWMPHVVRGLETWKSLPEPPAWNPTGLWARAGHNSWAAGVSSTARQLEEETLEVRRRVLGPEHPDTLISMHNLLAALSEKGEADEALILELLKSVRKLPESTPIRVAAERQWGSLKNDQAPSG